MLSNIVQTMSTVNRFTTVINYHRIICFDQLAAKNTICRREYWTWTVWSSIQ